MRLALVLLNYNDAWETLSAVKRVYGFKCIDHIVVVDNASTDNSIDILKKGLSAGEMKKSLLAGEMEKVHTISKLYYESEPQAGTITNKVSLITGLNKISLIKNKRNGGYGYGNNRGVKYAYKNLSADLVLIANPDSVWQEDLVKCMISVFEKNPPVAVVGAIMRGEEKSKAKIKTRLKFLKKPKTALYLKKERDKKDHFSHNEFKNSGWMYRNFLRELLHSGPLCKRIFANFLDYPQSYYNSFDSAVPVYAVHGSLLMIDAKKFLSVSGYDEDMFLYAEEYVLGYKLKKAGYKTCLIKKAYIHKESGSIKSKVSNPVLRQKARANSELIYFGRYLGVGKSGIFLAKLFEQIVLLETKVYSRR